MATRNKQNGSALLESLPALTLMSALVVALFAAAYFLFAHGWIRYQGEQTLYCMAEYKPAVVCRQQLRRRVARLMPWGEIKHLNIHAGPEDWSLEIKWQWQQFTIHIHKKLSNKGILRNRALRW